MSKLKELRDRRAAIVSDGEKVVAGYKSEDREATAEEIQNLKDLTAERKKLDDQIEAAEEAADLERAYTVERVVSVTGGRERVEDDPLRGWRHFGEFAHAVIQASRPRGNFDQRLKIGAAATTYSNENVGADGGFLVPPGFSSDVFEDSLADDAMLPLTSNDNIAGNTMAYPANEDEPWSTSGLQANWEGEGDAKAQSKVALKLKQFRLRKLAVLAPVTDELMEDASALDGFLGREGAKAIRHKVNDALINGDGAGKPVGVVGHAGTVSVAKEGSQTAATINIENVTKMYARAINPGRSIWIANIDCFPQLFDMKDNSGNRVYQTVVPGMPDGMSGMLLGRPLRYVEQCPTLGTVGDIIFGDWEQYKTITKAGGVQSATSMHLWFDQDITAFKLVFRIDGKPWRDSTLSPAKGANARGNFVTVATRA